MRCMGAQPPSALSANSTWRLRSCPRDLRIRLLSLRNLRIGVCKAKARQCPKTQIKGNLNCSLREVCTRRNGTKEYRLSLGDSFFALTRRIRNQHARKNTFKYCREIAVRSFHSLIYRNEIRPVGDGWPGCCTFRDVKVESNGLLCLLQVLWTFRRCTLAGADWTVVIGWTRIRSETTSWGVTFSSHSLSLELSGAPASAQ